MNRILRKFCHQGGDRDNTDNIIQDPAGDSIGQCLQNGIGILNRHSEMNLGGYADEAREKLNRPISQP